DVQNGLGSIPVELKEDALEHLALAANGDMRAALNGLELAVSSTPKDKQGNIVISLDIAEECMQKKSFSHDKDGDAHYDVLTALQNYITRSDAHSGLDYRGRLIAAADLDSIDRRKIVCSSEDTGLDTPQAAPPPVAAVQAAERLGFHEARIPLAVAIVDLSS